MNVDDKKYRYQTEIQQMMYVFGEVQDALPEVTMLAEEIVQRHVTELIAKASAVARKRASRFITVDDVVFLIRHDRAKVNRLKDYLSWKDLRKNVKEDANIDNDIGEEEAPESTGRTKKRVKFNWEVVKEYTDLLEDDSEDEDEEDIEAYRDSLIRLKAADDVTRNMTQSEYMFYSECKTASFTHRKAKRFREWTSMTSLMDSKPNDDFIDVIGFLCYELVRKLTETALLVKRETTDIVVARQHRQQWLLLQENAERESALAERQRRLRGIQPMPNGGSTNNGDDEQGDDEDAGTMNGMSGRVPGAAATAGSVPVPQSGGATTASAGAGTAIVPPGPSAAPGAATGARLFGVDQRGLAPARTPLQAVHIREAYRRLQLNQTHTGLFRGGTLKVKPRLL
ncbi:hypothetical protein AMAG_07370 [Allomyces macrogynus ATCC 38327]|uniref:Uncharacterized protein n=1 Tax=Allomyces macrogynus (strain ATCC 38327) TaxID=578462 RepID=A0A0L0SI45_ALLM3|nr:hypothetical protein AMAG_07370 [Allomyces macrogynus ATCC 38327]|eukprot:KNE62124.1 hypothetical protein AMAG_07370 [Allomyces macrogynus ATCC 38327]